MEPYRPNIVRIISRCPMGASWQQARVLSHLEERAYFDKASPMLHDIARIILETGMRPEEVYTMRPENVDLRRKTI